ncbi:GNAT family N-acetyltransferase [Dorea sp. D27]
MGTRNNGKRIALFFVDSRYQRRGIRKLLLQAVFD